MEVKICRKCGAEKPLEQFAKGGKGKPRRNICKPCWAAHQLEPNKLWNKKHYAQRKPRIALWRQANREKIRQQTKDYARKHKERLDEARRIYVSNHREVYREAVHRYNRKYPERVKATLASWLSRHPDYMAAKAERRRALEMHCEGSYTQADINQLMIIQGGRCAGCARSLRNYHVDHVMPLTKKGRNDISNLQLLCPPCNLRKSSKHPDEWAYEIGRLFV